MEEKQYNYKCDLWSLGIIIYELYFQERPFKGTDIKILKSIEIKEKILKKTGDEKLDDLIDKLLEKKPEKRIGWNQYFGHPFFDVDEITIIYKILKDEDKYKENEKECEYKNEIRLFGDNFIKKNKSKCIIKYKGKKYALDEDLEIDNKEDKLEIKLCGINNINDLSDIFFNCDSFIYLLDISKWNTSNVTNMSYMFYGCSSLKSLPDISKWNTSKVTNMNYMFYGCSSLKSLPDISKWNTNNITQMIGIFSNCKSLKSLTDISKWNTNNVTNMIEMFYGCSSLKSLPDISK